MRKELVAKEDPKSPISEIFRTLRTNIQFMNTNKKLQTVLVTSTMPGEGKSWVSANLAVTFAQAGKRVVLVDADMRKGRQYSIFGASPRPGLSNYLSNFVEEDEELDLADYIQETPVDELYLIAAGNIPPNPSELLVSENMINLIENLKDICDIIIVDGPPTQLVTDSLILARIVDSTVVVAASNQTKKEDLNQMLNSIQKIGGKIAGVVVNKVQMSAKKYEQKYYYGSTSQGEMRNTNMPPRKKNPNAQINLERTRRAVEMDKKPSVNKEKREELPKALKKENNQKKMTQPISLEKTNDILNQINKYLDEEKKNLNKQ